MKWILFLMIFIVGCSNEPLSKEVIGGSEFCNEEANRLGITGEYYCEVDINGEYVLRAEPNENNKRAWEEFK